MGSRTQKHQGFIADAVDFNYSTVEEIIEKVGDAAFVDKINTFGIALFEHSGKTYIRLKYK